MGEPEDSLLDALLRACQPKPSITLLPGFGRDLQPYFSEDAASAIGNAQKPRRSRYRSRAPVHLSALRAVMTTLHMLSVRAKSGFVVSVLGARNDLGVLC